MTSIQHRAPDGRARHIVLAILAAVVLCAIAISVWRADSRRGLVSQLARANLERAFAPRVSIPTRYQPCDAHTSSQDTVPREDCGKAERRRLKSPLRIFAQAAESIDPDSLRGSALAGLIWWDGEDASLDEAIASLTTALRLSPNSVPLRVDLSAAHLVRAERTQNSRDRVVAIEHADHALALEPGNEAAAFNSALAKQTVGLDEEADQAWNAYLAIDSTSTWADEARQRQEKLITRMPKIPFPAPGASAESMDSFVAQYPQEAREYGWERVLSDWGAAVGKGNSARAGSMLALAQGLGGALERRSGGDASLADAVGAIRAVAMDEMATLALARAHQDFAAGVGYFGPLEHQKAADAFDRVVRARPASRVLLQWTALFQAGTRHYKGERDQAVADLRALLSELDRTRHPALAGRAGLMLGTVLGRPGQLDDLRAQLRIAVPYLEIAGEYEYLGDLRATYGDASHILGDTLLAYTSMHRALEMLRPYRQSDKLQKALFALGRVALQDEMPHAARAIYNEDIAVATRTGRAIDLVEAHLARARARVALGDSAGARQDVAAVRSQFSFLPEERQRSWSAAFIALSEPENLKVSQMDSAVEEFADNVMWHVPALIRRADLLLDQDSVTSATADLQTATESVRSLMRQQVDVHARGAMMEQARGSFDRLFMLHLHNGQVQEALRTLEAGRMSFAPRRQGGLRPGEGRLAAPPGQVAVEYALIRDTLYAWTIGDSIRLHRQWVDPDSFQLIVEQANAALESRRASIPTPALRQLYDWLIRPIRPHLGPPETQLIIMADGEVAGVPFAALMDRNRYLIQDYSLRFAATLEDAARPLPAGEGPVLLVADPAFDRRRYLSLDPLPWAREEVASIAGRYPGAVQLQESAATRQAFVAQMRRAGIIHYAGHAVFDDARPERSYLLLAGGGESGRLTADSISTMRLGARLVVLSACSTLRSGEGRSGGLAGLSGALLAAGAGGVVGSLWDVNDQRTAPLMKVFHGHYLRTRDPARALRDAQLEMLRSENRDERSPAAWAGFRYTGG